MGVLFLYLLYVVISNLHQGVAAFNFRILFVAVSHLHIGIACWILLYILSFSVVIVERWVANKIVPPEAAYISELVFIALMNVIACYTCLRLMPAPPPLAVTFGLMVECCRLNMKVYKNT